MRCIRRLLLVSSAAAAALGARAAHAQVDITRPLPNVLLLVDTSGSMENMIDGQRPEDAGATCNPGTATPLNRWATLVSSLTGTINNFSCYAQDRNDASFVSEYTFDSAPPYDQGYYLPFHRILSNGCTAGAGTTSAVPATKLDPQWMGWPLNAIHYHPHNQPTSDCGTAFSQLEDGLLDAFEDRVRFGLMTFDTFPDPGTGFSGVPNGTTGMAGMWSYYANWQGTGVSTQGQLPACTPVDFEVGARNQAAPPWEGRLIPFGLFDAPLSDVITNNEHIQETLKAMRPYGATPLAGMLQDAYDFIYLDTTINPLTSAIWGPADDPLFGGGCRKTYVIVLSDGEPNMDMRPGCESIDECPYEEPWLISRSMSTFSPSNKAVQTFAIGFGLASDAGVDCDTLTPTQLTGSYCDAATGALKACCNLGRIAYEGGTGNAIFADSGAELSAALSDVLAKLAAGSTSRTYPVFSTASTTGAGSQGNAPATSYQFVASFFASPSQLWQGNLERKRYRCDTTTTPPTPVLEDIDPNKGDDFGANLNSNSPARKFVTVVYNDFSAGTDGEVPDPDSEDVKETVASRFSLRPKLGSNDGYGTASGTASNTVAGGPAVSAASVISDLQAKPAAMNMSTLPPQCLNANMGPSSTAGECIAQLMKWQLGQATGPNLPTRVGSAFGAIYHSTPALIGTPRDFLRDESYSTFALAQAQRPLMLYTGTTDGQLHAFKVASNDPNESQTNGKIDSKNNNEFWSFIPPYVLPGILSQYDRSQQFLLDGAPVVRDVVFERDSSEAQGGTANWRTVLVGGGGKGGGYYYALDITNPAEPVFLWQLSTDVFGKPLFGRTSGTPAIANIALRVGSEIKEVAVAVLPGGFSGQALVSCPPSLDIDRRTKTAGWGYINATYVPRDKVRCWKNGAARSLTVVRIDTGEILQAFRGHDADGPRGNGLDDGDEYQDGLFDSPVSGIPVPYPSAPGTVANRVYVGDADGTLWRIDLSDPDPPDWRGKIAWDAYSISGDTASSGQPIQTPPIVSVDGLGNTIILFSTGDQEMFTSSTSINTRVWSIIERPTFATFTMDANWFIPFTDGKRVTGPISLFNSVAYFATFTPDPSGTDACSDGEGAVWGVDYIVPQTPVGVGGPRPEKRFDHDNNPVTPAVDEVAQGAGTVVFGVAVTQTPTCTTETSFGDAYLGTHTSVESVGGGEFQLVFQTGQAGSASQKSVTNTKTQVLPRPRETTRIDSWAAIVE